MEVDYSVLEYLYRDAGNWRTDGAVLLLGIDASAEAVARGCVETGGRFVPEQVGLPALHERHWREHEDTPNTLDHAFHEFVALRPASPEQVRVLAEVGTVDGMLRRFRAAAGRWDACRSDCFSAGVFLWDRCPQAAVR